MIYFIQAEIGGPVKIGYTGGAEWAKRLETLRTGCPFKLEVIATMPGTRSVETDLHWRFAGQRVNGEWFEPNAELVELIASCDNHHPLKRGISFQLDECNPFDGAKWTAQLEDALTDEWQTHAQILHGANDAQAAHIEVALRICFKSGLAERRRVWKDGVGWAVSWKLSPDGVRLTSTSSLPQYASAA